MHTIDFSFTGGPNEMRILLRRKIGGKLNNGVGFKVLEIKRLHDPFVCPDCEAARALVQRLRKEKAELQEQYEKQKKAAAQALKIFNTCYQEWKEERRRKFLSTVSLIIRFSSPCSRAPVPSSVWPSD
jgi:hypothetical protein